MSTRRLGLLIVALLAADCRCEEHKDEQTPDAGSSASQIRSDIAAREWRRSDSDGWLAKQLRHSSPSVRARAALAIGRIGLLAAREPLIAALSDSSAKVRRSAAFALRLLVLDASTIGGGRAQLKDSVRAALRRALGDEREPGVRRALIRSLGWVGKRSDASLLRPLLAGSQAVAAATAWGQLARRGELDHGQSAPLLKLLVSDSTATRRMATWALYELGAAELPDVAAALRARGEKDDDAAVRMWAVRALGREGDSMHRDWFLARLHDYDYRVRSEAARALAGCGKWCAVKLANALRELWRAVSSNHYRLTGAALHPILLALDALEDHARVATIHQFAGDLLELTDATDAAVDYSEVQAHSVDLVNCAAARLWDLGEERPARTPTCGTAHSKRLDPVWRRIQVVDVVADLQRDPAWRLTMLRRYLTDGSPFVRASAVSALGRLKSQVISPPLLRAITDSDERVFTAAARVVSRRASLLTGDDLGLPLARKLAKLNPISQPIAACAAIDGLAALRVRAVLPLLQELASNPAWAVRECARRALSKIGKKPPETSGARRLSRGAPALRWSGRRPLPRHAVLVTYRGEVQLELLADETPATVAHFARLAMHQAYKGTKIYRVERNVSIRTAARSASSGEEQKPGYSIPCELTPRPFSRGSIGMVIEGRDTGRKRLFITLSRQPQLDGRNTQFARVVEGMDVIAQLQPGDVIKDLYIQEKKQDK